MSLGSLLKGFGGSAGKTVEAPLRAIVHEVLKEQGYASPAEVQTLRDELRAVKGRLDAIEGRMAELVRVAEAAQAAAARAQSAPAAPAADPRVDELAAEVSGLARTVAALGSRPEAGPPLVAATRGACKVEACGQQVRSKGFCSAHYQQWRRGTLKGYVSQEGQVEVDGRVLHVSVDHAGGAVRLDGRRILVDGQAVSEIAAG